MPSENSDTNGSGAPTRGLGVNSLTLLVLPIFFVFALSLGLCARELAAHIVAGNGDGAMLTRISDNSPETDSGYELAESER